ANDKVKQLMTSREQNCMVALKVIKSDKPSDFLNEFKAHYECQLRSKIVVVSQNIEGRNKLCVEPKIADLGFARKINDATGNTGIFELNETQLKIKKGFLKADKYTPPTLQDLDVLRSNDFTDSEELIINNDFEEHKFIINKDSKDSEEHKFIINNDFKDSEEYKFIINNDFKDSEERKFTIYNDFEDSEEHKLIKNESEETNQIIPHIPVNLVNKTANQ
ncbi:27926_t:CDS:10, partial [Racocetra persica]